MKYNPLGSTDLSISELSFGTWAIGGSWGQTNDTEALKAIEKAIDHGVNFFDTADVYGAGHSEELLAKATKGRESDIHIATKFCRQGDIHDPANYSMEQVSSYLEDSLRRLNRDQVDLYQIHCPPFEIMKDGSVFDVLEKLKQDGKIRYYGVSVETVEEGLYVLENSNASALQVIFNIFRQKPMEQLFPKALEKQAGVLARVPLASGLLTGKFNKDHTFEEDDHRSFNQNGEAFNVGETFAGLEFNKGVELSRELEWIAVGRGNMTQASIRWILQQEAVTSAIPGFRNVSQVEDNLQALEVKPFTDKELADLKSFYKEEVHDYIRGVY
ncbi:aldo/keto reductase [Halobacillus salinarum]|uniref:Aldo/keto reductase n=1 Tax=Halobacillus salinarum TaxID=2932257 RepID=A0ABY4EKG8_9BACI|nr:aldo/keto reductase [Halobacillus salinarum]UOQ44964.1 aldo/keto reductase [Halobacillus salinarum]